MQSLYLILGKVKEDISIDGKIGFDGDDKAPNEGFVPDFKDNNRLQVEL